MPDGGAPAGGLGKDNQVTQPSPQKVIPNHRNLQIKARIHETAGPVSSGLGLYSHTNHTAAQSDLSDSENSIMKRKDLAISQVQS